MTKSRADLERAVAELVRNLLRPKLRDGAELRRTDVPEWDSLKHVEIVFALEDQFDVRFDESEFALMDSPAAIAALMQPRLGP